ncbi:MAG: hypothetical protein ACFFDK_14170 [Promethearchaeota archaeon]
MIDILLFITALISAIISYLTGVVFLISYLKEHKFNRFLWCIAFILYAIGHTIAAICATLSLDSQTYLLAMWVYVNLSGAGTTGLILYSTFPFITEKLKLKVLITGIFIVFYVIGSALLAFVLPAENPLAFVNPTKHTPLNNMSWWVVELLIPVSFFIGIGFFKHYRITGSRWGLLISLSFIIYAIILFIWPVPELKPIFYIIRTISVTLLCIGGVFLAQE